MVYLAFDFAFKGGFVVSLCFTEGARERKTIRGLREIEDLSIETDNAAELKGGTPLLAIEYNTGNSGSLRINAKYSVSETPYTP